MLNLAIVGSIGDKARLNSVPSVQATNIVFSNVKRDSVDVSLTRGSGQGVLVVARLGEPVTDFPLDGISYTGSTVFGTGDEVGLGNYVIYNGSGNGNIGTITNLPVNVEIFVRAFERNGNRYNTEPSFNNGASQELLYFPLAVFEAIASDFMDWTFSGTTNGSPFTGGINRGSWGDPQIGHTNPPTLDTSRNAIRLTRANSESVRFYKPIEYPKTHEIAMVLELIGPSSAFVRNLHAANVSETSSFITINADEQLLVNGVETGVFLPENTKFALRIHIESGDNKSFVQINKNEKTYFTSTETNGNDTVWFGSKHTTSSTFDGYFWALAEHMGTVPDEEWEEIVDYYII